MTHHDAGRRRLEPAVDGDQERLSAVPTLPDSEAPRAAHDEMLPDPVGDRMPAATLMPGEGSPLALLRIRVEQLLQRREAAPTDAWQQLGPDVIDLLVRMLDDPAIVRDEALRQRIIATLGQIGDAGAAARLGEILVDPTETPLTQTFAASALGRMEGVQTAGILGRAIAAPDDMVRRQVALSLGRRRDRAALPYLLALRNDRVDHVAAAATSQLRQVEEELGIQLDLPEDPRGSP